MATITGQINPFPVIRVYFENLAKTAIQKQDRGIVYLVLQDETAPTELYTTFLSPSDINAAKWTADNIKLLNTCYEVFSPYKVVVRRRLTVATVLEPIQDILAEFETRKMTHLAIPEITSQDDAVVVAWVKTNIEKKGTVYASTFANNTDSCSVVEINNDVMEHSVITNYTPAKFAVMLVCAMAGCPLNRSLDNVTFPTLTYVDSVTPVNGKFSMYMDDEKVRVKLAINSKTTFDSTYKENTRYIKIWEGINIIRFDIQETFKDYWLGLYLNTYENKVAFCDIVNKVYFPSITPNVLSPDFNNYVKVDWEAHKAYVVLDGGNPDTMTEAQLKQYPTNGDVVLTGEVRFTNSMINLDLRIMY